MKIFKFDVDESFAKANNELLRDSNRLRISGLVLGILLIIGGAAIWWGFSWGCLLYTSPSPRDVEESRMPSSA